MKLIEQRDYPRESQFAIRLALEEALTNAVRHGNAGDESKTVHVSYHIADDRVKFTIRDEGPGFDPDELADPTLDEHLTRPHGRGVMLMRAYMTQVSFNEAGNEVTLIKSRTCASPSAD